MRSALFSSVATHGSAHPRPQGYPVFLNIISQSSRWPNGLEALGKRMGSGHAPVSSDQNTTFSTQCLRFCFRRSCAEELWNRECRMWNMNDAFSLAVKSLERKSRTLESRSATSILFEMQHFHSCKLFFLGGGKGVACYAMEGGPCTNNWFTKPRPHIDSMWSVVIF